MPSTTTALLGLLGLLGLLATAAQVSAHGYVQGIVADGTYYTGYLVNKYPYMSDPPASIGWTEDATDLGYVAPDAYAGGDIICHKNAPTPKPPQLSRSSQPLHWNGPLGPNPTTVPSSTTSPLATATVQPSTRPPSPSSRSAKQA
ncbi:hypothetical protein G7Y89_g11733 [Cudoniella acicularis]|uniref:Uncharacterized protein n=1 Tax=Cudoniella acicularis TaxID=354080 RepID=A0A8H4VXR2_9HELO|nr:hypothetical protein G7Y89_g11733 [Cudoniella acicularis]